MVSHKDLYLAHYFNIYICDLFYHIDNLDMASYTDDNTPYTFSSEVDATLKTLKRNHH